MKLVDYDKMELKDKEILELLKPLPEMYENGEIIEVGDACFEIYNAILDFTNNF